MFLWRNEIITKTQVYPGKLKQLQGTVGFHPGSGVTDIFLILELCVANPWAIFYFLGCTNAGLPQVLPALDVSRLQKVPRQHL